MQHLEAAQKQAHEAEKTAISTLERAESIEITNDEQYADAAKMLKNVKDRARDLEAQEKGVTKPINDSLKAIRDLFRAPKDTLKRAEQYLKNGMSRYHSEQERIAAEARRKAEAAARKERERLQRRADAAAKKGNNAKAQELQMQSATVTASVPQQAAPKAQGVQMRSLWKAEVTDFPALVRAVAEGKASIDLLAPNSAEINKRARALKGDFSAPGIVVREEKSVAA